MGGGGRLTAICSATAGEYDDLITGCAAGVEV